MFCLRWVVGWVILLLLPFSPIFTICVPGGVLGGFYLFFWGGLALIHLGFIRWIWKTMNFDSLLVLLDSDSSQPGGKDLLICSPWPSNKCFFFISYIVWAALVSLNSPSFTSHGKLKCPRRCVSLLGRFWVWESTPWVLSLYILPSCGNFLFLLFFGRCAWRETREFLRVSRDIWKRCGSLVRCSSHQWPRLFVITL